MRSFPGFIRTTPDADSASLCTKFAACSSAHRLRSVAPMPSEGGLERGGPAMTGLPEYSTTTGVPVSAIPDSDVVTGSAWKALAGSALGYAMDGFDLLILGFMLGSISADLALTPAQAASLVTATLIGAVIGGIFFGMVSDRIGRVRVLTWTIVVFAVFTGLCALAQGYYDLLLYRTLAGVGLGGEFGIGMALVAEAWPPSMRARASSYVGLGWQAGVLMAALLTPLLLPVIGWRGMFAVGLFPAVAAFFIRRGLQEPQLFVAKVVRAGSQSSVLRQLVADARTTRISLGMIVL